MTHRLIVGGDLVLYGDVGDMWGDGSGFSARDVIEALSELKGDITVRLNSGGGLAFDGVAIYNALRAHAGNVTVMIDGIAASAASIIALGGTETVARNGSVVMIHDPSAVTVGAATDHRKSADTLDMLANSMAAIYAQRMGGTPAEMRDLMLAETWMTADEAVSKGFAHRVDDMASEPVAAFDYGVYSHTPSDILQAAHRSLPANQVATATVPTPTMETPLMANKPIDAVADTPATDTVTAAAPAKDVAGILARCTAAKLSLDEANAIIAKADTVQAAQDLIIDVLASRDPSPRVTPAVVVADGRDRFKMGVEKALLGKAMMGGGERNEFSSMSLREIARASLEQRGIRVPADPMAMVQMAFAPVMSAGMHSTSDFADILSNVAHKSMLKGYEEAAETFEAWTAKGSLSDFKTHTRLDLNLFPSLAAVPEGAEYSYATMGDRSVTISLATYGKMFAITRQAIINDDMNAFTKVPSRMGRAAKRTIGNLVYAVVTDNAAMADGYNLFSTDHANLAGTTGAPTVTTVDAGRAAMAKQSDPDDHATGGLNIRPSYLLVPVELEGKAQALMAAEFDPAGTQRNPNYVRGLATVISEARLSTASSTAWYLAANPSQYDTIEVAYLNGVDQPVMEQREGWNVDGLEYKVRIDAGVQALDYRGLYKNAG